MSILVRLADLMRHVLGLRGRADQPVPDLEEGAFASVIALISPQIAPREAFVRDLGWRLRSLDVGRRGAPARGLSIPSLKRVAALALPAVLIVAVVVVGLLTLNPFRAKEARADPLRRAYESIVSLGSVNYRVQGEITPGMCGLGFNTPLSAAEQETLRFNAGTESPVGNVILCLPGPEVFTEDGQYDLVNTAFRAKMTRQSIGGSFGPDVDPALLQPLERVYVDGVLYVKEGAGPWRVEQTNARWVPFAWEGVGRVPAARLDALAEQYETVEALPDAVLNGERLKHFRAERTSQETGVHEAAEVWVGEDGVPRKAIVSVQTPFSIEEYLAPSLQAANREFADPTSRSYPYRNLPFVRRGDVPSKRTVVWTYGFSEFDRPVEIAAPISGQGGLGP